MRALTGMISANLYCFVIVSISGSKNVFRDKIDLSEDEEDRAVKLADQRKEKLLLTGPSGGFPVC